MYCKDCKFREKYYEGNYICRNYDKLDEDHGVGKDNDQLSYSYNEGGYFQVGDFFGCVHFKQREVSK